MAGLYAKSCDAKRERGQSQMQGIDLNLDVEVQPLNMSSRTVLYTEKFCQVYIRGCMSEHIDHHQHCREMVSSECFVEFMSDR